MTAAVFGFAGVIVGALLNVAATAWQASRSDRSAARVAARLVHLELRAVGLAWLVRADAGETASLPAPVWEANQAALARGLPDRSWEAVVSAFELVTNSSGRALASALKPGDPTHRDEPVRSDEDVITAAIDKLLDASVAEPRLIDRIVRVQHDRSRRR
jgi:hypothetical protein